MSGLIIVSILSFLLFKILSIVRYFLKKYEVLEEEYSVSTVNRLIIVLLYNNDIRTLPL